ncbi:MAG: lamin tail domain-containing protein [Planctomycetota bacterium]
MTGDFERPVFQGQRDVLSTRPISGCTKDVPMQQNYRLQLFSPAVFLTAAYLTITVSCFSPHAAASLQNPPAPTAVVPAPGDVAISEIMFNPAPPSDDNDGEYFEVTNISSKILDFSNLYIQDLQTPGSATAPYFKIPAGALGHLHPGESFLFARSGDSTLNGGIPKVDYIYSVPVGGSTPADKSKVSHTAMPFSNSAIDFVSITLDAPFNLGGFVIEMVTFDPTKAPLTNNSGIGFERANLLAPWAAGNIAASSANFGGIPQFGTPGARNSNDTTLYPCYYSYSSTLPGAADTGVLTASGPASVHAGTARLLLKNGVPGQLFAFGIAATPAEYLLFDGTVLVDLLQCDIWALDTYVFDSAGMAFLDVAITPQLLGAQYYIQWFCYDPAANAFVFSNGLGVDIAP